MPCLYCEESIPLLRELDGSQFCSEDHRRKYASRQESLVTAGGAAPSRDLPELRASPARLADFSSLATIREAYPELRGAEIPISRYCDLMLAQSRRRSRERSAMRAPGASMVPWMPGAVAPGEGRGSSQANPRTGRIALGVSLTLHSAAALLQAGFLTPSPTVQQATSDFLTPAQSAIEFRPANAAFGTSRMKRLDSSSLFTAGFLKTLPAFGEAGAAPLARPQEARAFQPRETVLGARAAGSLASGALLHAGFSATTPAVRESRPSILASPQPAIEFGRDRIVLGAGPGGAASATLLDARFATTLPAFGEGCSSILASPQPAIEFGRGRIVLGAGPGGAASTTLLHARFATTLPAFGEGCSSILASPQPPIAVERGRIVLGAGPDGSAAFTALLHAGFATMLPAFGEGCSSILAAPQSAIEFPSGEIVLGARGTARVPVDVGGKSIERATSSTPSSAGFLMSLPAFLEPPSDFQTPPQSVVEFPLGAATPGGMEMMSSTALLPAEFLIRESPTLSESPARAESAIGFRPYVGGVALNASGTLLALDFTWNLPQEEPELDDQPVFAAPLPADFLIGEPDFQEAQLLSPAASQSALGFPLEPVWLPALFAIGDPASRRTRPWSMAYETLSSPSRGRDSMAATEGPCFSGLLAWPQRSGVYWEFRETWSPPGVIEQTPEPTRASMTSAISPWAAALQFWRSAPAVARGVALAVPLMAPTLFVAPSIGLQIPSMGLSSISAAARARATVDLEDDFHSGLDGWKGKEGWSKTWSFDSAGSVRPGSLALLRESIPLKDYHVELLGQIDSKALGFVLRAADMNNYQAVKLAVLKPGPLPTLALVRYAVIDGHEGPKTQTPLILEARSDTLYKFVVDVKDDHFSVLVNGVYAGSWTEGRLKSGGVGFFADKGEGARLRWVHVIDKQDFLGWICYQVSQWTADRRTSGVKQE